MIGARSVLIALLLALLEPTASLRELECDGDLTGRLALMEDLKTMPFGAVWDFYCASKNVPVGHAWMNEVRRYEKRVMALRV